MSEGDPEVTELFEELRAIVDTYAGPGTDLSEVRRDVRMNRRAGVIRKRLQERFGLSEIDGALSRRGYRGTEEATLRLSFRSGLPNST